jgi:mono/diheme cytochrome c family protein
MKLWTVWFSILGLLTVALMAGCASARRGEPLRGPLVLTTPAQFTGQAEFLNFCQRCHPGGEAGVGPGLNNKHLPAFVIRMQVRNGLGAMPRFSSARLNREQLADVIAYLKTLRKHH